MADDRRPEDGVLARVRVTPDVPMQMYTCVPAVVAMGVVRALRDAGMDEAGVLWLQGISLDGHPVAQVRAHAGYDGGMYADCELVVLDAAHVDALAAHAEELGVAMRDVCAEWEAALRQAQVVAGPLAPMLDEYFDLLDLAGQDVDVLYPNGRVALRGRFAGVDVWGRACVLDASGAEKDFSPEEASLRAAR